MSRDVSSTFKQAVFSRETSEVFLLFVTINHEDISPIRVCSNAENVTQTLSVDTANAYKWTESGSGTSEYYAELLNGHGDPWLFEPDVLIEDSSNMTPGTIGSLSTGEWAYGDNDSLDYNTLYVRLTDSSDPDSKAADYIQSQSTFVAYPFQITLPEDSDSVMPQAIISIDNVHRTIVESIRSISTSPTVTMQVALASSPNVIEAQFPQFQLKNVSYNALVVSGKLSIETFLNEPYPGDLISPSLFPGIM